MRAQATALFVFRQKTFLELQTFQVENSATAWLDVLELYRLAASQPFRILYVNPNTTDPSMRCSIFVSSALPDHRGQGDNI